MARIQRFMKRRIAICVVWVVAAVLAQTDTLHQLEEGRTTLDEKSLLASRDAYTQLTQKDPNNALNFYQLARANGYLVEAYDAHGNKKAADKSLDAAIAAVERSIALNDKSADAHSLLADFYGRRISLGGFMVGMRFGPKSDAENKKALALEPNNPRVAASLGRQYLHAPKMFGGDVDKAIASFRKATTLDPANDENWVWLAIACRTKGDQAAADKAIKEALRLNPRGVFAQHIAAGK